jgi:hypothetical protein
VKYSLLFFVSAASIAAFAQSTTTSFSSGLNGERVANNSIVDNGAGQKTELYQSINGRKVPLQQTEERVISQNSSGRTVETVTKKFDPNGALASTEKTVTQEEKLSDGMRAHSTIYRSDVNGSVREIERKNLESHTQGGSSNSQTEIARPDPSGSFQTVEKRSSVTQTSGNGSNTDETVYRRLQDGTFSAAVRDISETTQSGSQSVKKSAHYEPTDSQQLQLTAQTVTSTSKRPDGSTVSDVSYYGTSAGDGRVRDRQTAPQLREQQRIERVTKSDGSVTEIVAAQRPTVADPSRLGPMQKISETICLGMCK